MHHLPFHVVPNVLLRTRALQKSDRQWQCTHVVVGEEGRGKNGGGEWEEQCSADDVMSRTTAAPAVWRCAHLPQPWSVGERLEYSCGEEGSVEFEFVSLGLWYMLMCTCTHV